MTEKYFYKINNPFNAIILIFIFVFVIGSSVSIFAENETTLAFSKAQLSKLKDGNILVDVKRSEKQPKGMVNALVLIDAPPATIWKIMTDCPEAPTFVPGLKSCKVLETGKNWEIIRHDVKWIWFFPKISYVFRADYKINRRIDFVRIKGDLREMRGSWHLLPLNGESQTVVNYEVYLDPSFFIPQWLVERSLMTDLRDMLAALRTRVQNSLLNRQRPGPSHSISIEK
jgi:ribosome-associated toxin RatA of RatAB toxin-antitoxin module